MRVSVRKRENRVRSRACIESSNIGRKFGVAAIGTESMPRSYETLICLEDIRMEDRQPYWKLVITRNVNGIRGTQGNITSHFLIYLSM